MARDCDDCCDGGSDIENGVTPIKTRLLRKGQSSGSQVNVQERILPELSDEVKCLVHDRQEEQEQRTQAQGWVAHL